MVIGLNGSGSLPVTPLSFKNFVPIGENVNSGSSLKKLAPPASSLLRSLKI